jgi:hypothetical protein
LRDLTKNYFKEIKKSFDQNIKKCNDDDHCGPPDDIKIHKYYFDLSKCIYEHQSSKKFLEKKLKNCYINKKLSEFDDAHDYKLDVINFFEELEDEYIEIPMRRGFNEIKNIFDIINTYGGYIMGGYPLYCSLLGSEGRKVKGPSDIDIFFKNKNCFLETMVRLMEKFQLYDLRESVNSISFYILSNKNHIIDRINIQLIKTWNINNFKNIKKCQKPEDIANSFDFSFCKCWIKNENIIVMSKRGFKHASHKRLFMEKFKHNKNIINRYIKYEKKGYSISFLEVLKIMIAIDNMNQDDKNFLYSMMVDVMHDMSCNDLSRQEGESTFWLKTFFSYITSSGYLSFDDSKTQLKEKIEDMKNKLINHIKKHNNIPHNMDIPF